MMNYPKSSSWLMVNILLLCVSTITLSQIWQRTSGPLGFSVEALTISNSDEIYAGTYGGGVYRSTNNGESWIQLTNGLTNRNVIALTIISNGDIFAGTANSAFFSTDNGVNWSEVDTVFRDHFVYQFASKSPTQFFAGTSGGVFRSTNNGTSWTRVGPRDTIVNRVGISPIGIVFAWGDLGAFKSTDNGDTWTFLKSSAFFSRGLSLAVSSFGYLLVGTDNAIYLSANGGDTWNMVAATNSSVCSIDIVYLGPSPGDLAATDGGGVYRSIDFGNNWLKVNSGLTNIHSRSIAVNNTGIAFVGTSDTGIYRGTGLATSVQEMESRTPKLFSLWQNYPDPFNPSTTIEYALPMRAQVRLHVFNILGQQVATLYDGDQAAGYQKVQWNANVPSGIYFSRIEATAVDDPNKHFIDTKKMLLLR